MLVSASSVAGTAVLVVIPALNEALHIANVLAQLRLDLPSGLKVRFCVCDGGSSDGTPNIVEQLAIVDDRISLLHNPKRLQSAAVNLAVQVYGDYFDILIRCDAHSIYPIGYISALLDTMERTGASAVVVPMDSIGDTCMCRAVAWISDTPVGSGGSAHRGGGRSGFVDHGHHAAFRMDTFVAAGGYEESFSHNEDAELDCRQVALGGRIYLDSAIRIGYLPRGTFGGLWRQYYGYGRGRSRTVRRHRQSIRMRQLAVPFNLAACSFCIAFATWWPLLLLWPVAYLTVLGVAAALLVLKHQSACALLSAPAAACMHTAWALGFAKGMMDHREHQWLPCDARPLVRRAEAASHSSMPR